MKELRALTSEELAVAEQRLLNPAPGSRAAAARDYGIDLTLLLSQLRLSPKDRVREMLDVCRLVESIRGRARTKQP